MDGRSRGGFVGGGSRGVCKFVVGWGVNGWKGLWG